MTRNEQVLHRLTPVNIQCTATGHPEDCCTTITLAYIHTIIKCLTNTRPSTPEGYGLLTSVIFFTACLLIQLLQILPTKFTHFYVIIYKTLTYYGPHWPISKDCSLQNIKVCAFFWSNLLQSSNMLHCVVW